MTTLNYVYIFYGEVQSLPFSAALFEQGRDLGLGNSNFAISLVYTFSAWNFGI
jgi:hypothetical protein